MIARFRGAAFHLQMLVICAVALGGGGSHFPLRNLAVILLALALLAFHYERVARFVRKGPGFLKGLLLASLAVPLLQVVPLPSSIWQLLPGAEVIARSIEIAGADAQMWRPLSVNSGRTMLAFSACLPAAAIISIGWTLTREQRHGLAYCVVIAACVALLIGTAQLSTANTSFILFDDRIQDNVLYATFANRNSTGLFMVIGVLLAAGLPTFGKGYPTIWAVACAIALLVIATVLTQSRSAMVLLALALAFVAFRYGWPRLDHRRPSAIWWIAGIAAFAFLGLFGASTLAGGRVAESLQRFDVIETDRLEMWDDSAFIANKHLPFGTGIGTFNDVFEVHESLEYTSPRRAGRAHNDYLEAVIESGFLSIVLIIGWLSWVIWSVYRRGVRSDDWSALAAGSGIACIAAQSLLDYPLRTQTMLCVAAVLIVLLASQMEERA